MTDAEYYNPDFAIHALSVIIHKLESKSRHLDDVIDDIGVAKLNHLNRVVLKSLPSVSRFVLADLRRDFPDFVTEDFEREFKDNYKTFGIFSKPGYVDALEGFRSELFCHVSDHGGDDELRVINADLSEFRTKKSDIDGKLHVIRRLMNAYIAAWRRELVDTPEIRGHVELLRSGVDPAPIIAPSGAEVTFLDGMPAYVESGDAEVFSSLLGSILAAHGLCLSDAEPSATGSDEAGAPTGSVTP